MTGSFRTKTRSPVGHQALTPMSLHAQHDEGMHFQPTTSAHLLTSYGVSTGGGTSTLPSSHMSRPHTYNTIPLPMHSLSPHLTSTNDHEAFADPTDSLLGPPESFQAFGTQKSSHAMGHTTSSAPPPDLDTMPALRHYGKSTPVAEHGTRDELGTRYVRAVGTMLGAQGTRASEAEPAGSRTSSPDSGVSTTLMADACDMAELSDVDQDDLEIDSDECDSVADLELDDGGATGSHELLKLLNDSIGHGQGRNRKGTIVQPLFTAKQETALRRQLNVQLQNLEDRQDELRGLSPMEKKKLRNRKASRVSRLKKKLYVFELQRSYVAVLKEKNQQAAEIASLKAALRETADVVRKHDPTYTHTAEGMS
eukprot:m.30598 g.30598  ORF g.30598 m.30598 type:complete len:366 (-) comp13876_c0_seq2:63-1160(-)